MEWYVGNILETNEELARQSRIFVQVRDVRVLQLAFFLLFLLPFELSPVPDPLGFDLLLPGLFHILELIFRVFEISQYLVLVLHAKRYQMGVLASLFELEHCLK